MCDTLARVLSTVFVFYATAACLLLRHPPRHSSASFLFLPSNLLFQYSLTTCECSAFLSFSLFLCTLPLLLLTHNQNFPFIQTASAGCSLRRCYSSSTPSFDSLFFLYCTCTVPCSISAFSCRLLTSFAYTQQRTLLLLRNFTNTYTFFLFSSSQLRRNSAPPIRWTHCQIATASPPAPLLCSCSCASSRSSVVAVVVATTLFSKARKLVAAG